MAALVLVKHSLPQIDPASGPNTWSLSDTGRERCRRLAELLAHYAPATLVSNPERKAWETAAVLADGLGSGVSLRHDRYEHGRDSLGWLEDEAFDSVRSRFAALIQDLGGRSAHGNLSIIAHGTVISAFAAPRFGPTPPALWRRLGLPPFVALSVPNLVPLAAVREIDEGS